MLRIGAANRLPPEQARHCFSCCLSAVLSLPFVVVLLWADLQIRRGPAFRVWFHCLSSLRPCAAVLRAWSRLRR